MTPGELLIGGRERGTLPGRRGRRTVTAVGEEAGEGSPLPAALVPESTAETRACARGSLALPARTASQPVTERARAAGQAAARAAERGSVLAARYLDRPGSLVHAQPPTLARAREQHHEAAARHAVPVLRFLRLAWGYFHLLLVKPALNGLEWATETPARFTVAVIIGLVVWLWS